MVTFGRIDIVGNPIKKETITGKAKNSIINKTNITLKLIDY